MFSWFVVGAEGKPVASSTGKSVLSLKASSPTSSLMSYLNVSGLNDNVFVILPPCITSLMSLSILPVGKLDVTL